MICKLCGKSCQQTSNHQLYCAECRAVAKKNSLTRYRQRKRQRDIRQAQFEAEWARWKADFAAGKTVSNFY